jgi:hypothetical protein
VVVSGGSGGGGCGAGTGSIFLRRLPDDELLVPRIFLFAIENNI